MSKDITAVSQDAMAQEVLSFLEDILEAIATQRVIVICLSARQLSYRKRPNLSSHIDSDVFVPYHRIQDVD